MRSLFSFLRKPKKEASGPSLAALRDADLLVQEWERLSGMANDLRRFVQKRSAPNVVELRGGEQRLSEEEAKEMLGLADLIESQAQKGLSSAANLQTHFQEWAHATPQKISLPKP